jgi:hypothetical protein
LSRPFTAEVDRFRAAAITCFDLSILAISKKPALLLLSPRSPQLCHATQAINPRTTKALMIHGMSLYSSGVIWNER